MSCFQDVIFAAGGDPVEKEKTMPYNIPIEEARRILGLAESPSIAKVYITTRSRLFERIVLSLLKAIQ